MDDTHLADLCDEKMREAARQQRDKLRLVVQVAQEVWA